VAACVAGQRNGGVRGRGTLSIPVIMAAMTGWRDHALAAKGFMPAEEGDALHAAALAAGTAVPGAPFVEVGSYCGRSTIWLAAAARECGTVVFAVDHHRGSEENQPGWEHHDPGVVDRGLGLIDTMPLFRRALFDAGLERYAIAVVGESPVVAAHWSTPAALVFIDGGHGAEPARADYAGWTPKVAVGGALAIHDVFSDPAAGGRPPYEEIFLPAIESGRFTLTSTTGSLRVLTRTSA
jgi:MMP 1-O-methyltransferase